MKAAENNKFNNFFISKTRIKDILYFNVHSFPYLLILLQFRDPSYELNLSTKAVLQKWFIKCKRAKYLQFELIFRRA